MGVEPANAAELRRSVEPVDAEIAALVGSRLHRPEEVDPVFVTEEAGISSTVRIERRAKAARGRAALEPEPLLGQSCLALRRAYRPVPVISESCVQGAVDDGD